MPEQAQLVQESNPSSTLLGAKQLTTSPPTGRTYQISNIDLLLTECSQQWLFFLRFFKKREHHQLTQIQALSDTNTRTIQYYIQLIAISIFKRRFNTQALRSLIDRTGSIALREEQRRILRAFDTKAIFDRTVSILNQSRTVVKQCAKKRPTLYHNHENNTQGHRVVRKKTIDCTEINTQAITMD